MTRYSIVSRCHRPFGLGRVPRAVVRLGRTVITFALNGGCGLWSLTPIQMIVREARRFEMRLTSYCSVLQGLGIQSPGELAIHIIEYVCDGVFGEAFEAGVRRPTKVRREDDVI